MQELARFTGPVIQFGRTVTADCAMAGRKFHRADKVLLIYTSANRDGSVFTDPDPFDLTRSP